MCFSSAAQLNVKVGYELLVRGNVAELDGGGIAFDQGASVLILPHFSLYSYVPYKLVILTFLTS